MSAADMERIRRIEARLRHGKECHEGVTRKGEFQPCDKPAIALRDSREDDAYYPVCAYHARGFCIPLVEPDDAAALVAALRAVLDLHRPVRVYAYAEDCGCGNEDHVIIEDEWGEDLCFDTPTGDVQCSYCRAEQSYVEHPCENVRAIEEALK